MTTPEKPTLLLLYVAQDRDWAARLKTLLRHTERMERLSIYDPHEMVDRKERIYQQGLTQASVTLILVSPHFLADDHLINEILPVLKAGLTTQPVYWVPTRPCMHADTPLHGVPAIWDAGVPLSSLSPGERDQALVQIAEKVARLTNPVVQSGHLPGQTGLSESQELRKLLVNLPPAIFERLLFRQGFPQSVLGNETSHEGRVTSVLDQIRLGRYPEGPLFRAAQEATTRWSHPKHRASRFLGLEKREPTAEKQPLQAYLAWSGDPFHAFCLLRISQGIYTQPQFETRTSMPPSRRLTIKTASALIVLR